MGKIDDMIQRLCPNGVEYLPLRNILTIKNGSDYKDFPDGDIPVYGSGGIIAHTSKYSYNKPSVLIPRKGSLGKLYYVDEPFWNVDTVFYTIINTDIAVPKFVYYCLIKANLEQYNTAGGVPSLTQKVLNNVIIPIPPLEIQNEIVRVLDSFTALTAELEAELEARQKQYEYYRDKLLTFSKIANRGGYQVSDNQLLTWLNPYSKLSRLVRELCPNGVEWYKINDLGVFYSGLSGKSKEDFKNGNAKFISYINIYNNPSLNLNISDTVKINEGEKQNKIKKGDILFTGSSETPDECGMSSVVTADVNDDYYLNSFCFGLRLKDIEKFNLNFLKHLFRSWIIRKQIFNTASGVTRFNVSKKRFAEIEIPVPPMPVQEEIVRILDKFEKLTTDISEGLPAEIAARQKQYEYYRDRLLNFKRLEA